MSGFASIHRETQFPHTYEETKTYQWVIYSNNMREICRSKRCFLRAHHCREDLKRFLRLMNNIHVRSGIVDK